MKHLFDNHCPRCKTVMILTHPRDHAFSVWICPVCGKTRAATIPSKTEEAASPEAASEKAQEIQ